MKLIDADTLQTKITNVGIVDGFGNYYGAADVLFKEDIDTAPIIDPVKHGKWVGCDGLTCLYAEKTSPPTQMPMPIRMDVYRIIVQIAEQKMDMGELYG